MNQVSAYLPQVTIDPNTRQRRLSLKSPACRAEIMIGERSHQRTNYQNNYDYRPNS
ncbi:MAG: hypothetical protein KME31_17670 [Tolypothrix carrinoi HA7290-LM1]|nr:hypothetical protein [Tolypothrix carrinoi HA7290-LM1]